MFPPPDGFSVFVSSPPVEGVSGVVVFLFTVIVIVEFLATTSFAFTLCAKTIPSCFVLSDLYVTLIVSPAKEVLAAASVFPTTFGTFTIFEAVCSSHFSVGLVYVLPLIGFQAGFTSFSGVTANAFSSTSGQYSVASFPEALHTFTLSCPSQYPGTVPALNISVYVCVQLFVASFPDCKQILALVIPDGSSNSASSKSECISFIILAQICCAASGFLTSSRSSYPSHVAAE